MFFILMLLLQLFHIYRYSHTSSQSGATSNSLPADSGIEKIVRQERERLEEILRGKGMQRGSYPSFIVAAKGPQVR